MTQTTIRLINWNTEANKKRLRDNKPERIRQYLHDLNADIICLTEAHPDYFPTGTDNTHLVRSQPATSQTWKADRRKVMMWSKWGWSEADTVGSADLPPGRYLHAVTTPPGCAPLHVIGVCVPYGRYSGHKDEKLNNWDGHKQYSVALKPLIAPHRTRTIIAGDFNMPFYGSLWGFDSTSQRELLNALTDYRIITEHLADPDSVKPLIDHIALTPDLHTSNLQAVGRLGLSDHPLTVADIQSDSVR